jgi:non-specific serine/threonine protein kinase/serine/threonine-protein kinase
VSAEPPEAARFDRVTDLFHVAVDLRAEERETLLARECAGDPALRREVEELLAADAAVSPALGDDAMRACAQRRAAAILENAVPETIGGCRILGVIGRGGMGVVYRAEQPSPRRVVAVKVLAPAFLDPSVIRRFEQEAQVLARLDHPGIARILHAGVERVAGAELPYLVMEHVDGDPLGTSVHARGMGVEGRLALVADVCDAVQHAHQKGVVHRDLKPPNILVDRTGRPHIVDFGVARTFGPASLASSLATAPGQLVGTLPYMSPEQLDGDPTEIDTRIDVYALGIVLFELMAGRLPHDFRGCSIVEAARMVREEAIPRLASIDRRFRGDIDTIVARATAPDRERRYQSARELATDIRDHLAGRPIAARRDSLLYVARRLAQRHAAVILVSLFVGAAIIGLGAARLRAQLRRDAYEDAMALLVTEESITDPFTEAAPPHLLQLQRAAAWADDLPVEQAAAVHSLVGLGLLRHGEYAAAEAQLRRALDLRRRISRGPSLELAAALHDHGRGLYSVSQFTPAEARYRAALDMRTALREATVDEKDALAIDIAIADSMNDLGACLRRLNRLDEAEELLVRALDIRQNLGLDRLVAASINNVATCLRDQGRLDEAEASFREAVRRIAGFADVTNRELINLYVSRGLRNAAECCLRQQRADDATPLIAEALAAATAVKGASHPDVLRCHYFEGWLCAARGDSRAAESRLTELARSYAAAGNQPAADAADALALLGRVRLEDGRPAEAAPPLRTAADLRRSALGAEHPRTQEIEAMLAQCRGWESAARTNAREPGERP